MRPAIKRRLVFTWAAFVEGLPTVWRVIAVASILVGGSGLAFIAFALDQPALAGVILLVVALLITGEGAFRLAGERPRTNRSDVKDLLGQSVDVGVEILKAYRRPTAKAWTQHTREIVNAALGPGEAAHVFTADYETESKPLAQRGGRMLMMEAFEYKPPLEHSYINNLRNLISRVEQLELSSDFDVSHWEAFDLRAYEATNARTPERHGTGGGWTCPWCATVVPAGSMRCSKCFAKWEGGLVFRGHDEGLVSETQEAA